MFPVVAVPFGKFNAKVTVIGVEFVFAIATPYFNPAPVMMKLAA
jgi:hypothetical protein